MEDTINAGIIMEYFDDKDYINLLHIQTGTEIFIYRKNKNVDELKKLAIETLKRLIHKF